MIDGTYENICVSRGNDDFFIAFVFDWFKWYIIFFVVIFSEGTAINSPSENCMQDVMFSVLAPPRKTGIFDWQWKVIQPMKACWNFILLSDEAQNLSISTGNCCLLLEMLVSISSNLLLPSSPFRLLNALLEIQIKDNIHAVAAYIQRRKCFPNYFKEIFVSYQIHLFICHLPSIRHKINNNHCFQSFFRL